MYRLSKEIKQNINISIDNNISGVFSEISSCLEVIYPLSKQNQVKESSMDFLVNSYYDNY